MRDRPMSEYPWGDVLPRSTHPERPDLDDLRKWSRSDNLKVRRVASTLLMDEMMGGRYRHHLDKFLDILQTSADTSNWTVSAEWKMSTNAGYPPVADHPLAHYLHPSFDHDHPIMQFLDNQRRRLTFVETFRPDHFHTRSENDWMREKIDPWETDREPPPMDATMKDGPNWGYRDLPQYLLHSSARFPWLASSRFLGTATNDHWPLSVQEMRTGTRVSSLSPKQEDIRNIFVHNDRESHPCANRECSWSDPPPPLIDRIGR